MTGVAGQGGRPNVLLVTVDQWPGHLLGIAGHPAVQTPTLDDLARAGTRFANAYSECPICVPARRTLMTGQSPRRTGDRIYDAERPMPQTGLLAQAFRDGGYQAQAVGKLHVFPQRDRIGFDDVILDEEGRAQYGVMDDYEILLGDRGHPGAQFDHGMSTDGYVHRAWHLDEALHVTNWATQAMIRQIKRRDQRRPGFWYLSYRAPHPPLVPPQAYLDLYRDIAIDAPVSGDWAQAADLPYAVASRRQRGAKHSAAQVAAIRRAFYALCTHIDHQLRLLIGTLREECLLDDTVILFTSDHGDMLGDHGMWAKSTFYDASARVPMILVGPPRGAVAEGAVDGRLVGLADVMPTLLTLAGLPVPGGCDGLPMLGTARRELFYGEFGEGPDCSRMIRDARFKLIWYPVGNAVQLFDMAEDPQECRDLSASPDHAAVRDRLAAALVERLYGCDRDWLTNGRLTGLPNREAGPRVNRNLSSQRGHHWPPQLHSDMPQLLSSA